MKQAKEEGWESINLANLTLKNEYSDITSMIDVGLRDQVTPKTIFLKIISKEFIDHIVECTNADLLFHTESVPGPKNLFTSKDVILYISMILHVCAKRIECFKSFLEDSRREIGMTKKRFKRFSKHLSFTIDGLTESLNRGFERTLQPGGHGVVDESMIPWTGKSEFSVFLPRKPKDTGLRAYLLCFSLDVTGQPVCFRYLPEMQRPCMSGREVLRHLIHAAPAHYITSYTADAFFGSVSFLEAYPNHSLTLSLNKATFPYSTLFSYELGFHEVRIFQKGSVIVTLWHDGKLVLTGSNMFRVVPVAPNQREGRIVGYPMITKPPFLSAEKIHGLKALLSPSELKEMAKRMGLSTGGSAQDLAFRIGGRIPPPPDAPQDLQDHQEEEGDLEDPEDQAGEENSEGEWDEIEEDQKAHILAHAHALASKHNVSSLKALLIKVRLSTCIFPSFFFRFTPRKYQNQR